MKPLTLNKKRFVAAVWLVAFLFIVGNRYFAWGIFGDAARIIYAAVILVGVVGFIRFGPKMLEEIHNQSAVKREAEAAAERARDKSNDAAETDQLRRSIGMPLSDAREPAAQHL